MGVNVEREALHVLGERGWFRVNRQTGAVEGTAHGGEACLLVAMAEAGRACSACSDWRDNSKYVREVIVEQFPDRSSGGMIRFNDHPDTTVDDVILVLEKASLRRDEAVQ